jgi:hypothetical protein
MPETQTDFKTQLERQGRMRVDRFLTAMHRQIAKKSDTALTREDIARDVLNHASQGGPTSLYIETGLLWGWLEDVDGKFRPARPARVIVKQVREEFTAVRQEFLARYQWQYVANYERDWQDKPEAVLIKLYEMEHVTFARERVRVFLHLIPYAEAAQADEEKFWSLITAYRKPNLTDRALVREPRSVRVKSESGLRDEDVASRAQEHGHQHGQAMSPFGLVIAHGADRATLRLRDVGIHLTPLLKHDDPQVVLQAAAQLLQLAQIKRDAFDT